MAQARGPRSQEERSEASIGKAMDAALELFSTQGYRATSLRQIADRAEISVGNIYHHFPDKEAIYNRLIERYWERLLDPELRLNRVFAAGAFPEDLEALAAAIEEVVEQNSDHILLIYVDVIEFGGRHIRAFYENMASRFQAAYAERFAERQAAGEFGDADPMTAVMVASRWLFYFYTVEKCFGVPMHFGMTPHQAVDGFIHVLRHGLLPRAGAPRRPVSAARRSSKTPAKTTTQIKARAKTRPGQRSRTAKRR